MFKEKIKQKIKELKAFGKELEALLKESEDKTDSKYKLKLNTGSLHYHGNGVIFCDTDVVVYKDCFNCFLQETQAQVLILLLLFPVAEFLIKAF